MAQNLSDLEHCKFDTQNGLWRVLLINFYKKLLVNQLFLSNHIGHIFPCMRRIRHIMLSVSIKIKGELYSIRRGGHDMGVLGKSAELRMSLWIL